MWILFRMSSSTDDVRLALVQTGNLLKKLRTILEEESGVVEAKQYACNILQGLLSDEGDDDEVMDAVLETDFVPSLAKYMKYVSTCLLCLLLLTHACFQDTNTPSRHGERRC